MNIAAARTGGTMDTTDILNMTDMDTDIHMNMGMAVTATAMKKARKAACAASCCS